jgi:hypothetical protein
MHVILLETKDVDGTYQEICKCWQSKARCTNADTQNHPDCSSVDLLPPLRVSNVDFLNKRTAIVSPIS